MDKNKTAVDLFNKLAKGYQEKYMDVSMYSNSLDVFCQLQKNNAEILELACGPGNITNYLLSNRPDLRILGTDLSPNMIDLATANNPTAEFKVMDSRAISGISKKHDAIMCGFFLPYLSKEEVLKLIHDFSAVLKPGGSLNLSTIEDDHSNSGFRKGSTGEEIYMHYYEADFLKTALIQNQFKIELTERIESKGPEDSTVTDVIIIALKEHLT
ncbi:MAG: class I SAM-dependent methyltransferase [Bacteroidota bacterium]|nr:class I SAM-dependent methyltransferase [Bacteroidota bacterium]